MREAMCDNPKFIPSQYSVSVNKTVSISDFSVDFWISSLI